MGLSTYRIKFLRGTSEFVYKELLEKYSDVEIVKKNELEIVFRSKEDNIEKRINMIYEQDANCGCLE